MNWRDFPGGPGANPFPLGLIPGQVNRSHVPQVRPSTAKRINIKINKKKKSWGTGNRLIRIEILTFPFIFSQLFLHSINIFGMLARYQTPY